MCGGSIGLFHPYETSTTNLVIVGAGNAANSRSMKLYDSVNIPNGSLTVLGTTYTGGDLGSGGNLNVTGKASFGGGFNVTGAAYSYTKNSQNSLPSDIYFSFSEIGSPPASFYAFSIMHDATPNNYNVAWFFVSTGTNFTQITSMGGIGMTISEDSNTANIYLYNIVTIWSYTLRANRLV